MGLAPSPAVAQAGFGLPPEIPDDPPVAPADSRQADHTASSILFGRFTSIQVNVNGAGANIVGDAANEPSIAVDPADHDLMAIGWRQFDNVGSNFRQAGFAYSTDAGQTWTTGKIQAGTFRSDPVLGIDAEGDFFYSSVDGNLHTQLFPSTNHGMTWGSFTSSYGGDKPWIAVDVSDGPGRDFIYEAWNHSGNFYFPNTFSRSLDDGVSFQAPSAIPNEPSFSTLDVAPDGTVLVVGVDPVTGLFVVSRSSNAQDRFATPVFTSDTLDLGGWFRTGAPNPVGLLGQPWIAVDHSHGSRDGWIYVLASVQTPTDPLDVHFVRSTDGGATWSAPVRVNDDAGNQAFQWFGTMSVSPDGRIDAVWNDTRGSTDSTVSALYYAFSLDGGDTWSVNEQASPTWSSMVGFPKQNKIGDYYHMRSDANGADLAYSATFNGGQDIYYLRLTRPVTGVTVGSAPGFRLHPNRPNPFRSSTTIRFDVPPAGARVRLDVIDVGGRCVATLVDGFRSGGAQAAVWDGRDAHRRPVGPGIYMCRYQGPGFTETRSLAIVK